MVWRNCFNSSVTMGAEIMMETIYSLLCGVLTPAMICIGGLFFSCKIGILRILSPKRFANVLTDTPRESGTSPFVSLTMALAGTLGVGNITGVAAAVVSGGAGAVFWMWAGAILSMSIKYGEVALAVKYRRKRGTEYFGGAMYYISDGLGLRFPSHRFTAFGGLFALLCVINSLVTGNIVQSNSAAAVVPQLPSAVTGAILAALVGISVLFGIRRIGRITSFLIPVLTGVYLILSLTILAWNIGEIPEICGDIFRSAFTFRAAAGGAVGITAKEAIRYGITRGIFSNEAGCGTSPTAHASADTKSPFHQGCFGIFEVIADTLILCTVTAFVLLIADRRFGLLSFVSGEGDAALTLNAYATLAGDWAYGVLALSVILFAYATVLAQMYYGFEAVGYLTQSRAAKGGYLLLSVFCAFLGAVIRADVMWSLADPVVCVMTVINIGVLFLLRREVYGTVKGKKIVQIKQKDR